MDSKIVATGIVAIVSATILIFLLVYFTNLDMLRRRNGATDATTGTEDVAADGAETQTAYGVRIGNNLKAFLSDETFFDPIGERMEDYTEEEVIAVSPRVTVENSAIVVRMTDNDGQLITGETFSVRLTRPDGATGRTTELVFKDDDRDGVIRAQGLSEGTWQVSLESVDGYHMPQDAVSVTINGADNAGRNSSASGNGASSGNSGASNSDDASSGNSGASNNDDADDETSDEENNDNAGDSGN